MSHVSESATRRRSGGREYAGEALFRAAFDGARTGMAVLTPAGTYEQANPSLCRLLGRTEAELLGQPFALDLHPDEGEALRILRRAIDAKSAVGPVVARFCRPDGKEVRLEVSGSLVRGPSGEAVRFVWHYVDVTGQHAVERELAYSELRLRSQDETRVQLEEQLRRAQRMEAVGRLAGGIAHDFNNMLAVILNYADFARRRMAGDTRTLEYLEAIHKAAQRSSALTRQLLIFARRDAATPEVLDLGAVVDEVAGLVVRTLGEDIELSVEQQSGLARVRLAASHAEQVLMNLAVNARDAMPRGGRLRISTRTTFLDEDQAARRVGAQPGAYVELAVADTGVGMSPEVLAVAFEPFFTTKEPGQGTGLGLSIVYGIVDEAGGFVEVESTLNVGTTFRILLPAADEPVAPAELAPPRPAPEGRGETVLVVEDEPAVRALTAQILEEHGYAAEVVDTPEAALERCSKQTEPYDLLLTDVVMPRISGSELAVLIRALRPNTKVLFMSGHADEFLDRHRVRTGEVHFLQKPFQADALLRAVRDAIDASRDPTTPR